MGNDGLNACRFHDANAIKWSARRVAEVSGSSGDPRSGSGMTGDGQRWGSVTACHSLIDTSAVTRQNRTAGPNPYSVTGVGPAFILGLRDDLQSPPRVAIGQVRRFLSRKNTPSLPLRPRYVLASKHPEGQREEDDDVCGHDEEAMEWTGQSGSGGSD